jgi:hypothetical protein
MFPGEYTRITVFSPPFRALPYDSVVSRNFNPRWVVDCRNCLASFTHSEVGRDRRLIDYLVPTAPQLPADGQEMECPSCKSKAVYTGQDLRYRYK